MHIIRDGESADRCRARCCGGYLVGLDSEINDGATARCAVCLRTHSFTVWPDRSIGVEIEHKPRGRWVPRPPDPDLVGEEWRPISGFPFYEVSNLGRVRSWAIRGIAGKRARQSTIVRADTGNHGHKRVAFGRSGHAFVHALVLEAFCSPRNGRPCARHLNGDPSDNRIENLAWGSWEDNEADKRRHGRAMLGERHYHAKLTEFDVRRIRALPTGGVALARTLGVSRSTITAIRKGRTWRHVT